MAGGAFGSLAAWDGPAGVVATDGRVLAGLVDRMGLRPVRWCADDRGWLYIGSESGIYGLDSTKIVASGQLQPGQMIALDTGHRRAARHHQILARIVDEARGDSATSRIEPPANPCPGSRSTTTAAHDTPIGGEPRVARWTVEHLFQRTGWDFERAVVVKEMAKLSKEPLSLDGFQPGVDRSSPRTTRRCSSTFSKPSRR